MVATKANLNHHARLRETRLYRLRHRAAARVAAPAQHVAAGTPQQRHSSATNAVAENSATRSRAFPCIPLLTMAAVHSKPALRADTPTLYPSVRLWQAGCWKGGGRRRGRRKLRKNCPKFMFRPRTSD